MPKITWDSHIFNFTEDFFTLTDANDNSGDGYKIKSNQLKQKKILDVGGYSTVYVACWQNKQIAVKKLLYNEESLGDYVREINILKKATDDKAPNIVEYFGYTHHRNGFSIVMEYMPKGNLGYYIQDDPIPWPFPCLTMMLDISRAVLYLHKNKIVHRDIKLRNLLVGEDGQIKLGDFGTAKWDDGKFDYLTGTPGYMAPEVIQKKPFTPAADIFSMMVVFWRMLTAKILYADLEKQEEYKPIKKLPMKEKIEMYMFFTEKGYRETIPEDCPKDIAKYITLGWMTDPAGRPDAAKIHTGLKKDQDNIMSLLKKSN